MSEFLLLATYLHLYTITLDYLSFSFLPLHYNIYCKKSIRKGWWFL